MTLNIIDTHAHLDMTEFDADREEVIARSTAAGVNNIITVGINMESCPRAIDLAEKHPGVWAVIGIHPQDARGIRRDDIDVLAALARHPRVVGIGELGLDLHWDHATMEEQLAVLHWQLEMAQHMDLPIVIHCRDAQPDLLPILKRWSEGYPLPSDKPRGVLHNFRDDVLLAERYLEMGFSLSIGAYIGYPNSAKLREAVKSIPVNKILIETDCPFLPPQKLRGKRNEPAYSVKTVETLAEVKGISPEEMARQTTLNAIRVFNLPEADITKE